MAKQISQETFDAVVKENIEEFDMEPSEAIEDAVSQFEAQGVNLSNIVRDLSLKHGESGMEHPVITAINSLSAALKTTPLDLDALTRECSVIQSECDLDLAHRCLAGKHDAYKALMMALEKVDTLDAQKVVMAALCSLCNGQPDVLEDSGRRRILSYTRKTQNPDLMLLLIRYINHTCIKHEKNRRSYVADDLIEILSDVLDQYKDEPSVVKEVCFMFRVLTFDDDIRVPFSSSHDHAKLIVMKAGALRRIMDMCKDYINDRGVLGELFATLGRLAVRDEFCQEILDLGGLQLMLQTMAKNIDHPGITKKILGVLKAIAGNDAVKVAIIKHDGAELILTALTEHIKNPGICEMGCAALGAIVLRNPSHSKQAMNSGAAPVLVKIIQIHLNDASVQKQASMAIRNLVARNRDYCDAFLELDIEDLLQHVYKTHKDCQDEVKAALRDLGCKVTLKELWKGEGRMLEQ